MRNREPTQDFVDEPDRGELIQPLPGAGNPLEELHVHLQAVPRLRLLVPLPALPVRSVPDSPPTDSSRGEPGCDEQTTRRSRAGTALQVVSNLARPEVLVLAQVHDLADHLARCGPRRPMRRARSIGQPGFTVCRRTAVSSGSTPAARSEMPARPGDVPGTLRCLLQDLTRQARSRARSAFVIVSPLKDCGQEKNTRSVTGDASPQCAMSRPVLTSPQFLVVRRRSARRFDRSPRACGKCCAGGRPRSAR